MAHWRRLGPGEGAYDPQVVLRRATAVARAEQMEDRLRGRPLVSTEAWGGGIGADQGKDWESGAAGVRAMSREASEWFGEDAARWLRSEAIVRPIE